jgi:predicted RNase H-like HicB family nuclease
MQQDIPATVRPAIRVILEDAGNNWGAYAPTVPGVAGSGATAEEARQSLEDGLTAHFEAMFADEYAAIRAEVEAMQAGTRTS